MTGKKRSGKDSLGDYTIVNNGHCTLDVYHKKIDEVMEDIYASASY